MSNPEQEMDIGYSQLTTATLLNKVGLQKEHITKNVIRVPLHHLNVGMFDTQGKRLIVCYVMKHLEQPSWLYPLHTKTPDETATAYSLTYKVDINKSFYGNTAFKYPLLLEHEINYVKRTSKRFTVRMKQSDQSPDLATGTSVEVNIDPVTKQPKPYPDWWKKQLNLPEEGPQLVIQPAPQPESLVLSDKRKIHFTDTDENNHTNYITYITMCLDSFYYNVLHGKYTRANKVFLNGWVKTLTVIYKGDSILDDILTIASWEDSNRQNTYHFEISNGNKSIVSVSLEFYTSVTENSHL